MLKVEVTVHINQDHKIPQKLETFEIKEILLIQAMNLPLRFFR